MSAHWVPGRHAGITVRLSIAFCAVAVLAVAVNLLVEHGTSIIHVVEVRPGPIATGTGVIPPRVNRPDPAPQAVLAALNRFEDVIRRRIGEDSPALAREAEEVAVELGTETAALLRRVRGKADTSQMNTLAEQVQAHRQHASGLVGQADERRRLLREYERAFDRIDGRVKESIDRAWKVFGRVVARRSLVELSRMLDGYHPEIARISGAGTFDALAIARLAANEQAFADGLRENERGLRRSQGDDWVDAIAADLGSLAAIRESLVQGGGLDEGKLVELQSVRVRLEGLVRSLAQSATVAPPSTVDGPRVLMEAGHRGPLTRGRLRPFQVKALREATDQSDKPLLIAWLSLAVLALLLWISAGTVFSIVWPVRRLLQATRRVADGEANVRVPRGGIRELDTLAVSFNQMAERLEAAQLLAHEYHGQLEARVEERTRQLQHLAEHDPLTQLPNRRQLYVQLNAALVSATASGHLVGVYFLDLDNFKNVNDSLGHVFGDRVLQRLAERLRLVCAPFGFAARVGGDEFTVVFEKAASIDAIVTAGQAMVRAFQQPLELDGRDLLLSISIGASVFPEHEQDAEALLRAADAALFRAKGLGRSQLSLFSPDLLQAAASRFSTEQGLRRAVERNEFELFFQPEVNAQTGRVELVEALIRWRLPDGRLLTPVDFLPVAEESGLIGEISDWVLRSAIETAARWYHTEWEDVRIAVNVSSRQLLDGRFVEILQDHLHQHSLPTRCLEIELTENVLQTNPATVEVLRRLRAAGFGVALDDFGTGYSSLVSLEQLPLTRVKLDRSLIESIDTSPRSLAIARAIIGLCTSLRLEMTAEGIERPEQLAILQGHPGMSLQGYLFSPPVPGPALVPLLARISLSALPEESPASAYTVNSTQTRRALRSVS